MCTAVYYRIYSIISNPIIQIFIYAIHESIEGRFGDSNCVSRIKTAYNRTLSYNKCEIDHEAAVMIGQKCYPEKLYLIYMHNERTETLHYNKQIEKTIRVANYGFQFKSH